MISAHRHRYAAHGTSGIPPTVDRCSFVIAQFVNFMNAMPSIPALIFATLVVTATGDG